MVSGISGSLDQCARVQSFALSCLLNDSWAAFTRLCSVASLATSQAAAALPCEPAHVHAQRC